MRTQSFSELPHLPTTNSRMPQQPKQLMSLIYYVLSLIYNNSLIRPLSKGSLAHCIFGYLLPDSLHGQEVHDCSLLLYRRPKARAADQRRGHVKLVRSQRRRGGFSELSSDEPDGSLFPGGHWSRLLVRARAVRRAVASRARGASLAVLLLLRVLQRPCCSSSDTAPWFGGWRCT